MTNAASSGPVALIDACVLAALSAREMLFQYAKLGAFQPRWSARIEEEWRSAARKMADPRLGDAAAAAAVDGEIALARARFPDALVSGWEEQAETLSLPDWDDRHVLAAAITAEAEVLVTDNLRDFPRRRLAAFGVTPEAADAFLWRLVGEAPEAMTASALAAYREASPMNLAAEALPAHFKRMRLPRFGKAIPD